MKSLPTEESLGLSPTEEELNSVANLGNDDGDDIPMDDDPLPEPEPEKVVEPEKPKDEAPKTVDLRALQEARNEAREAKQSQRVLEQRLNDVLAMMQRPAQPEAPKAPEVPDVSSDPLKALEWTQAQLRAMQENDARTKEEVETRTREETEYQAVMNQVQGQWQQASQVDPTLPKMYDGLRESMGKELIALGYTQQAAVEQLNQIERSYVSYSHQTGIPIADIVRNVAAARGVSVQPQQAQGGQRQQIDPRALADSQQRHMSLSDAPGGEAPPVMDAKALARMSDKEFKAWMGKKGNDAKFEEIMGKS